MDLFPFGTDNFVQSILQWHLFVPDPVMFHFMVQIVDTCQMLVIPDPIKHQFTKRVVQSTWKVVDQAMVDIRWFCYKAALKVSITQFCWQVNTLGRYFVVITTPNSQAALLHGCKTKTFQLCSIIIYLVKEWECVYRDIGMDIKLCAYIRHRVFQLFHMHRLPLPSIPVHPLLYQMDVDVFLDSWSRPPPENESTLCIIQRFRHDDRCSAQGCMNSIQLAGQSFQWCERCGLVPYCGHKCQTNAWKHKHYPHKLVCSALKNLVQKGGGSSFFFLGDIMDRAETPQNSPIFQKILQNWKKVMVDSDLELIDDW